MTTPDTEDIKQRSLEGVRIQKELNDRRRLALEDFGEDEGEDPIEITEGV